MARRPFRRSCGICENWKMAGSTSPSSGAKTPWGRGHRRTVVANACGNIASCEYYSLGCICLPEVLSCLELEKPHRTRVYRTRVCGSKSAYFMQRMPLNFCGEYRGIPRFARNDGVGV